MKTLICFIENKKLSGSLWLRLKKIFLFQYRVLYVEKTDEAHGIQCFYVEDYEKGLKLRWPYTWILQSKQKYFLNRLQEAEIIRIPDNSRRPSVLYAACVSRFLKEISYEKHTILGFVDGELLDYRVWIQFIRQHLAQINGLLIVSDMPESFIELSRDAWEEQGLLITVTGNLKELCFCDYVIDCSADIFPEKVVFYKTCHYLMLWDCRRKRKQIKLHNPGLKLLGCSYFLTKMQK